MDRLETGIKAVFAFMLIFSLNGFVLAGEPGFIDHGVGHRHAIAAFRSSPVPMEKEGEEQFILQKVWVGGYDANYLVIEVETGEAKLIEPAEIDPGLQGRGGWSPYYSRAGVYYDTLGGSFVEVDPYEEDIKILGSIPDWYAMSMTECDNGLIYAALHPNADLVVYDPGSGKLENHGPLEGERYQRPQYPGIAVCADGWIYALTGRRLGFIAYNPEDGERLDLIGLVPEEQRKQDAATGWSGRLWRANDGNVYARPLREGAWYRMRGGEGKEIEGPPPAEREIYANMPAPSGVFSDGTRIARVDVPGGKYVISRPGEEPAGKEFAVEYGRGSAIYIVREFTDGKIYGTAYGCCVFRYCPREDAVEELGFIAGLGGHINVLEEMNETMYGAIYSSGSLISYKPSETIAPERYDAGDTGRERNPKLLYMASRQGGQEYFGRPAAIEAHPDGRHIIIGGQPPAKTSERPGGGILVYDTVKEEGKVYGYEELGLYGQRVDAIRSLGEDGKFAIGGGFRRGHGNDPGVFAEEAELLLFDAERGKILFRKVPVPGAGRIRDLAVCGGGLVYGVAGSEFFVFDPSTRRVLHREDWSRYGANPGRDAANFIRFGGNGKLYVLFDRNVVEADPATLDNRSVAELPRTASVGMGLSGGRVYYGAGDRLMSVKVYEEKRYPEAGPEEKRWRRIPAAGRLASPDPHRRKEAIVNEARRGRRAVPDITRALYDRSYIVRRTAALLLSDMGRAGAESMKEALLNEDLFVQKVAITSLARGGELDKELLALLLEDPSGIVREEAVRVLFEFFTEENRGLAEEVIRELREGRRPLGDFDGVAFKEVHTLRLPSADWKFRTDPEDEGLGEGWFLPRHDDSHWDSLEIESAWQSFGYDYQGPAWYRRRVKIDYEGGYDAVKMHFGGVDEAGRLWVNGEYAGEHDIGPGGWNEPFSLDISGLVIQSEEDHIAVRVENSAYAGGIWQPVHARFYRLARPWEN